MRGSSGVSEIPPANSPRETSSSIDGLYLLVWRPWFLREAPCICCDECIENVVSLQRPIIEICDFAMGNPPNIFPVCKLLPEFTND